VCEVCEVRPPLGPARQTARMSYSEFHAQFQQLGECGSEVAEEELLVLGVQLHVLLELGVLQQRHVRRQLEEEVGVRIDASMSVIYVSDVSM
jgi:hypothetical protein